MYDLTSPAIIQYLCKKYGFVFQKSMGQNFLTDGAVIDRISDAATSEAQGVIEIGPGFGCLTAALATRAEKVVSIELDRRLEPVLAETLAGFSNVRLVWEDCMKVNLPRLLEEEFGGMDVSVAANLPYYITTPILMMLLESRLPVRQILVMVQKEVADRLCAPEGGKDYGAVTVAAQYYARVERMEIVPAARFLPRPKVDSAVLKLTVLPEPSVKVSSEKRFFALVKAAFAQRRKTLANALANSGQFGSKETVQAAIAELGKSPSVRGEALSLAELAKLTEILAN